MKNTKNPIWLDIETGGIDPSQSSILSLAIGQDKNLRSIYSVPEKGTFLSRFSEEKIIPQLQQASRKGLPLISERSSIESLIYTLEKSPKAPLAGFNIRGFDIGFIQHRSRQYGLEKRFTQAMAGRPVIDPVYQIKDIVASAISEHTEIGTFSGVLGNRTWSQAEEAFGNLPFRQRPPEYNVLAQVKGYLKASSPTAMFKGWKLEDLNKLLDTSLGPSSIRGAAHEAATDIAMTQRVIEAARSGVLQKTLQDPGIARQWMATTLSRGYHQLGPTMAELNEGIGKSAGRLLSQADINAFQLTRKSKLIEFAKIHPGRVIGMTAAFALGLSLISSKDDDYNSIEGLPHGGFAQSGRLQLTEFGSGYRGIIKFGSQVRGLFGSMGIHAPAFKAPTNQLLSLIEDTILTKMRAPDFIANTESHLVKFGGMTQEEARLGVLDTIAQVKTFHSELLAAKEAGHKAVMAIGVLPGEVSLKELKGLIKHERVHLGASARLNTAEAYLPGKAPGPWNEILTRGQYNQGETKSYFEEFVAYSHQAKYMKNTGPWGMLTNNRETLYDTVYADKVQEAMALGQQLEKEGQAYRLTKIRNYKDQKRKLAEQVQARLSGKDDAHNTVEGLKHGGFAQKLRKLLTPFGSGWDALRGFVKAGETFESMLKSSEFKRALRNANVIKRLGKESAMGEAHLMSATFRGQNISFVRKTGVLGYDEVATMKALQHDFAPTVYSSSARHIDMELFQGETARTAMKSGRLTEQQMEGIRRNVREMERVGISHGDYHSENIILTPEGKVGVIDFGASGPIGSSGLSPMRFENGEIGTGYYGGFTRESRKRLGKWKSEPIEIRDIEYDWGRVAQMEELRAKYLAQLPTNRARDTIKDITGAPTIENSLISTMKIDDQAQIATKKMRRSYLQRAASKETWKNGKNGGRRSRI